MNSIASWFGAIAVAVMAAIYPQVSVADGFTGEELLAWSETAQDSYFQTSVTMAAIIATETHKPTGDCLAAWYLSPDADRATRNANLRSIIARNKSYHPSSVIYLVLEQECGPFTKPIN